MKRIPLSRRRFLQSAAALGSIAILPRHVLGGAGHTSPNEKLTRAIIGMGGISTAHLQYAKEAELVAISDVDQMRLNRGLQKTGRGVKGYKDFRELLARPDIDIVQIATPPHWHACMAIAAAQAGKDIWLEKPMTRTIDEGRRVIEAVAQHQRILRLNTWFRFEGAFYGLGGPVAPLKKAIQNGLLGWPLKVTLSASTGFNWKSQWSGLTNLPALPVPPELDYDMWLGPAPFKPYHPHRVHGTFRGYWDYDGGGLGDMGQHYLDPIQYVLGKDNTSPVQVEADSDPQHSDAVGAWRRVWMRYADGCEIVLDAEDKDKSAAFIEGPKGRIDRGFTSSISNLQAKLVSLPEPEPRETDFLRSVRSRKKFALNEENGHRSCTLVNLAKIAVRTRRLLNFDPEQERFQNDDEANTFVQQSMRAPWTLDS